MKFEKNYIYSFVAPLMIILSILGFVFRKDNKQIYYLPIGLMGIVIITEKEVGRVMKRKNIGAIQNLAGERDRERERCPWSETGRSYAVNHETISLGSFSASVS